MLSRILRAKRFFLVAGSAGTIALAITAWNGDRLAIVLLAFFSLVWIGFGVYYSDFTSDVLNSWQESLQGWDETGKLSADLSSLLQEALEKLALYDPEEAQEIAERGNTIIGLRRKNFEERIGE